MQVTAQLIFAISGDGLFAVQNEEGETVYTRNGNFYFSTATEGMMLCTADGYPVLSTDGQPIVLSSDYNAANIKVSSEVTLCIQVKMVILLI